MKDGKAILHNHGIKDTHPTMTTVDFISSLPDDLLHYIGIHLAKLTSGSIVEQVQTACNLRAVGNSSFTALSNLMYEEIEPGCTRIVHRVKPLFVIPDDIHKYKDVAKRLEKLNRKVATLNFEISIYNKKVRNLQVCPLNDAIRVLFKEEYNKRITASRAITEYLLTEDDLTKMKCEMVRNPHYRSAASMRLYLLREVRAYCQQKYGSLEDERVRREQKARIKIDAKIQKRNDRISKVNGLFLSDRDDNNDSGIHEDPLRYYCDENIKGFVEDGKPCFRDLKSLVMQRRRRYDALVGRIQEDDDLSYLFQHLRHRVFTLYIKDLDQDSDDLDHVIQQGRADICRLQERQERIDHVHQLKERWTLTSEELRYLNSKFTNYIENTSITSWESFLAMVEQTRQRLHELKTRLQEKDCALRNDSVLCDEYILHNKGRINEVVDTMVEMKFFFEHTNYASCMSSLMRDYYRERRRHSHGNWSDGGYEEEEEDEDDRREIEAERKENSEYSKKCALEEWVRKFASKEAAKNCPYLPASLKSKIDRIDLRQSRY